jgi:MFS family permease
MPKPDRDDGAPGADDAAGADPEEPRHSTSLWRQRPLLLLTGARLCSASAVQMQAVAVGWLVYDMTRSAFALGLIGLAQFLPLMVLALPAGHAADHLPRRALLVLCFAIEFAATLGIGAVAAFGVHDPWPI